MESLPLELVSLVLSDANIETLINFSLVSVNCCVEAKRCLTLETIYYPDSKIIYSKRWTDKQGNYRVIIYRNNGSKQSEVWFNKKHKPHRTNGPASQEWFENGKIAFEGWYVNGYQHKKDGPAEQIWHANGKIKCKIWLDHNIEHRLDGPAFQSWYGNGRLSDEWWMKEGKRHRIYGPAWKKWRETGELWDEEWYKNGVLIEVDYKD